MAGGEVGATTHYSLPAHRRPVALTRRMDVLPENRGFVVDEIEATMDGERIGHLRIENVPAAAFRRFYPTVFSYMDQIRGIACLPHGREAARPVQLEDADLVRLLCRARMAGAPGSGDDYGGKGRAELLNLTERLEGRLLSGPMGEDLTRFRLWHVEKPFIAYVEAREARRGLGTLLYAAAGDWMRERGLVLRSSTLRTESAEGAWRSFDARGFTRKDPQGRSMLLRHAPDAMRAGIGAERISST